MNFKGIKSIDILLKKYAGEYIAKYPESSYNEFEEFVDYFIDNLNINKDTISVIPVSIQPTDFDVGIFNAYIEEMGASIKATTWIPKELALDIAVSRGSLTQFIEKDMTDLIFEFDTYDLIQDIFIDALYTEWLEEKGVREDDLQEEIRERFHCRVISIENSSDNKSVIITLEFST